MLTVGRQIKRESMTEVLLNTIHPYDVVLTLNSERKWGPVCQINKGH